MTMKVKVSIQKCILSIVVIVCMFGQKIALNIGGFEFSISLFAYMFYFTYLFINNKVKLNKKRLFIFICLTSICLFSSLINTLSSVTSLVYFVIIYSFFIFDLNLADKQVNYLISIFRKIIFFSAILGIVQFGVQHIGLKYIDFFDLIPTNFKLSGFNTYYSIKYGSSIMKSNGIIYLEPSFFSQFLAIGIILEMQTMKFSRKLAIRIIIYVLAIGCSYSGTGLMLLLIYSLPIFLELPQKAKLWIVFIIILSLPILLRTNYYSNIIERMGEINSQHSSASIRFINPVISVFTQSPSKLLIGNGAGAASSYAISAIISNYNSLMKMIFEYGLVATIFHIFLVYKSFLSKDHSLFHLSLLIMYFILGGNLLQPAIIFPLLLLKEINIRKGKD
jgi:hypothetical protein